MHGEGVNFGGQQNPTCATCCARGPAWVALHLASLGFLICALGRWDQGTSKGPQGFIMMGASAFHKEAEEKGFILS